MKKCVSYDKLSKKEKSILTRKQEELLTISAASLLLQRLSQTRKKKTVESVAERKSSNLVRLLNSSLL